MKLEFGYGVGVQTVELPEKNLIGVLKSNPMPHERTRLRIRSARRGCGLSQSPGRKSPLLQAIFPGQSRVMRSCPPCSMN